MLSPKVQVNYETLRQKDNTVTQSWICYLDRVASATLLFIKIGVLNDKRIKKTPLYETYVNSGAKIVEFGGWAMPVQFTSIKEEHNAVRYKVGMFDVSHMGEILIEGENASKFVQYLLSNDTTKLSETKAQYTALCNDEGGIIDDLVTYKIADNKYLLIVNAANTDKDFEWIQNINLNLMLL